MTRHSNKRMDRNASAISAAAFLNTYNKRNTITGTKSKDTAVKIKQLRRTVSNDRRVLWGHLSTDISVMSTTAMERKYVLPHILQHRLPQYILHKWGTLAACNPRYSVSKSVRLQRRKVGQWVLCRNQLKPNQREECRKVFCAKSSSKLPPKPKSFSPLLPATKLRW